jgi:twinkle protein
MATVLRDDVIDFSKYMRDTEPRMKVRAASTYIEQVKELFAQTGVQGALLPWSKTFEMIGFRPGEVSIWAGINGHGKSLILGQVALWFVAHEHRSLIASFEMLPAVTLKRMARQCSCGSAPTDAWLDQFGAWTDSRLWLYDHQGPVDWKRIAAVVRYAAERHEVTHFVVDSLMKTVRGEDDYNGQKDAIDLACTLARDLGVHMHIVHHIRKQADERTKPGKFDLKGSGAISDQVDNVLIVHRNKYENPEDRIDKEGNAKPDASLTIAKQRNGEFEGRVALWFDERSQQFIGQPHQRPVNPMEIRNASGR